MPAAGLPFCCRCGKAQCKLSVKEDLPHLFLDILRQNSNTPLLSETWRENENRRFSGNRGSWIIPLMIWPLTEPSDLKQRGASIRSQRCFLPPRGRRFEPVSKQPNQLDILLIRCLTSPDGNSVGPSYKKTSLIWRERIICVRNLPGPWKIGYPPTHD